MTNLHIKLFVLLLFNSLYILKCQHSQSFTSSAFKKKKSGCFILLCVLLLLLLKSLKLLRVKCWGDARLQITFHWSTGGNTSRPTALHLQRQGRNEDCWKMSVDVNNAGVKMIKKNPLKSKPISLHLEDHSSTMSRWKLNSNLVLLHSSHTNPLKSLNKFEQGDLSTFDT